MRPQSVLITAVLCFGAICAQAQEHAAVAASAPASAPNRMDPDALRKLMENSMNGMVPVMGRMTEVVIEAQLNAAAKPETAERVATFKKNLYDELVKKGFTTSQAMQLTIATGVPTAAMNGK